MENRLPCLSEARTKKTAYTCRTPISWRLEWALSQWNRADMIQWKILLNVHYRITSNPTSDRDQTNTMQLPLKSFKTLWQIFFCFQRSIHSDPCRIFFRPFSSLITFWLDLLVLSILKSLNIALWSLASAAFCSCWALSIQYSLWSPFNDWFLFLFKVVVSGLVIESVFMQMSKIKMRVHDFHVLKRIKPSECDINPSKNMAHAIPNWSIVKEMLAMGKIT